MPVFNLELEFNDRGALKAAKVLDAVDISAQKAEQGLKRLENNAKETSTELDDVSKSARKAGQEIDDLGKKSSKSSAVMSKLAGSVKGVFAGIAAAWSLAALNDARRVMVEAGSQAQETANKFNVVFSSVVDNADAVVEELRQVYGMSREGAQSALAGIADLLTGLGVSQQKALDLARQATQLGSDLASFTNYVGGATGAVEALSKAMLGEAEMAKSLGLVLGEDQMAKYAESVGKVWKELDLAEKAELRLQAAIKQSPSALGDTARSMDSYASQVRAAAAANQDFQTIIGEGLLPVHTQALKAINSQNGAFTDLAETISGTLLIEGQKLTAWLKDLGINAEEGSSKTSGLSLAFVSVAGACKAAWNGLQLVGRGIIGIGTFVASGIEMLADYTEALVKLATLDFAGAAEKARSGNARLPDWYAEYSKPVIEDFKDLNDAIGMALNPEAFVNRAKAQLERLREETRETAQELAKKTSGGNNKPPAGNNKPPTGGKSGGVKDQLAIEQALQKAREESAKDAEKLAQKEQENLQVRADFYRDLSQLSGDYGLSLEYQNQLIQQQAEDWIAAGVPQADVLRRIELMKQEMARDPWSGFVRGARKWAAETQDLARGVEQTLTNAFDGAADALANFVMTGKINFQSLANSIISDLARIAARQAIGGIVGGLVGGIGKLFGGFSWGGTSDITASSGAADSLFSDIASSEFHTGGMAWEKPDFTRSVPAALFADAPRFHNGRFYDPSYEIPAIIRRDESVLTPGQMRAIAGAGGTSHVTVNVVNQTSTPVEAEAQATPDGNGGFDLTMILREVDRGMVGLAKSGRSSFTQMIEKSYGLNRAGVLARGRR